MTVEEPTYTIVLRDGVVVYKTSDVVEEGKIRQVIEEDRHAAIELKLTGGLVYSTEKMGATEAAKRGYIAGLDII